jgi:integrase
MPVKQAKILSDDHVEDLLVFACRTRYPERNVAIVMLSVKAGLRAGEIAGLSWDMVLGPTGELGTVIELRDHAAKKGSGRLIPNHPHRHDVLSTLRARAKCVGSVVRSERGGQMSPVSIVNWFAKAYGALGLNGCSSHSGRRTFITKAARLVHKAGGSLRDVQLLAGHRWIRERIRGSASRCPQRSAYTR